MNRNEIKKIISLARARRRKESGLFLVEGFHAVDELLKSDWDAKALVMTTESVSTENGAICHKLAINRNIPIHIESARNVLRMSATESPQEILAVASIPATDLGSVLKSNLILVADGIRDPGNLGTIIRSAAAFGFEGLLTTEDSADLFSPKVVRATQGMLFKIRPASGIGVTEAIEALKRSHRIYALDAGGNDDLDRLTIPERAALVVGAEIAGVSEPLLRGSDHRVRIPMSGPVESLNAAVAASIAMYRFSRPAPQS